MNDKLLIQLLSTIHGRDEGALVFETSLSFQFFVREAIYILLLLVQQKKLNYWPALELELAEKIICEPHPHENTEFINSLVRPFIALLGVLAKKDYLRAYGALERIVTSEEFTKRDALNSKTSVKGQIFEELLKLNWPRPVETLEKFLCLTLNTFMIYSTRTHLEALSLFIDFPTFEGQEESLVKSDYITLLKERLYQLEKTAYRELDMDGLIPFSLSEHSHITFEKSPNLIIEDASSHSHAIQDQLSMNTNSAYQAALEIYQPICEAQERVLKEINDYVKPKSLSDEDLVASVTSRDFLRNLLIGNAEQRRVESRCLFLCSLAERVLLSEKTSFLLEITPLFSLEQMYCDSTYGLMIQELAGGQKNLRDYFLLKVHQHMLTGSIEQFALFKAVATSLPMSFFIRTFLQMHVDLIPSYELFVNKYNKVNDRNNEQHQIKLPHFLVSRQSVILQLAMIMGEKAFKWLEQFLANTVLSLNIFLSQFALLPYEQIDFLKAYFSHHQNKIFTKNGLTYWADILICMGIHLQMNLECKKEANQLHFPLDKIHSEKNISDDLELFHRHVVTQLLMRVLSEADLTAEQKANIDVDRVLTLFSPSQIASLFIAKQSMKQDRLYSLFLACLIKDLTGVIIHSSSMMPVSHKLERYNARIHKHLTAANINPVIALNYKKTFAFSYIPEEITQGSKILELNRSVEVLFNYLMRLEETIQAIEMPSKSASRRLGSILKRINILKKNCAQEFSALIQQHNLGVLKKIRDTLNALLSNETSCSPMFREMAGHFTEQYQFVQEALSSSGKKQSSHSDVKAIQHFQVEQWDKTSPLTFLLGDEVGCCLASNSTRFSAMVERRLDDAMLFHVVRDVATDKPIALIWLYFAYDADRNIYLIGNFIEIAAKYGVDTNKRQVIIDALLYFTGEIYCKDCPGIKSFLINQLDYGWLANTDQLEVHSLCDKELFNKVGGAFDPELPEDRGYTKIGVLQNYYLVSLARSQFHCYTPLTPERKARFLSAPVSEVIEASGSGVRVISESGLGFFDGASSSRHEQVGLALK